MDNNINEIINSVDQQYVIPEEWLEEQCLKLGKTNQTYNHYQALLKMSKMYSEAGLTPIVLYNPFTEGYNVTSEEAVRFALN